MNPHVRPSRPGTVSSFDPPVLRRCSMALGNRPNRRAGVRRLRSTGVALAVGLLAGGIGVAVAAPGQSAPPPVPAAHVWVTTPDGSEQMHDRGTVPFQTGASDRLTITVDPSLRYQTMDG